MNFEDPENITFRLAADFILKSNHPVFLTGKAGTGKTTFLRYIKENSVKNTIVVAPTGVAAMNAGGTTIHSFFQLPFSPFIPGAKKHFSNDNGNDAHSLISHLKLTAERKEILQNLGLLIIDEISMVRCDVLDAIDTVLRHVRKIHSKPFGGVQILYIGDMYQLPPVIRDEEWQLINSNYSSPFFFSSLVIQEQPPVYIELNKVYRQRDNDFIRLLNQVRNNEMDQDGYELLHSRYNNPEDHDLSEQVITLTTHNAKADAINNRALNLIADKSWKFVAEIEGIFNENAYPAEQFLELKKGAQVMFLKNDTEKIRRYYNGKIGIVTDIENDKIVVEIINGDHKQLLDLKKETWRNIRYSLNKQSGRIEEEELGSFTQYPVRLAWAITIHKSQGLTFEKAVIDAGSAFSPGQVYVALSRCTSLQGIRLMSKISFASMQSDPRIVAFAKQQLDNAEQSALLKNAIREYEQETLFTLFDFSELNDAINSFCNWISEPAQFKMDSSGWTNTVLQQWEKIFLPGNKFILQLRALINEPVIKDRVIAAVKYFTAELDKFVGYIIKPVLSTDNRQTATEYKDKLQRVSDKAAIKLLLIRSAEHGFDMKKYQEAKLSYKRTALTDSIYSGSSSAINSSIKNPELYQQLRSIRDEICSEKELPVYMVCSTESLVTMAESMPLTLHALGQVRGFGKVKLKQFGSKFINAIVAYCDEYNIPGGLNIPEKKVVKRPLRADKPESKSISFDMFQSGKTLAEIAAERSLSITTIENHLGEYVASGQLHVDLVLGKEKRLIIEKKKSELDNVSLSSLKNALPDFTYSELRWFIAAEKYNESLHLPKSS